VSASCADEPVRSAPAGTGPVERRDVIRNRAKLLAAADELVRARGQEATIDEIARHAGLGVGTAYRHFANKQALLEALFAQRLQSVVAMADEAAAMDDAGEALEWFIYQSAALLVADRGLRQAISGTDGFDALTPDRNRLIARLGRLVERARRAGAVRPDFEPTDVPLVLWIIGAVADYASDVDAGLWRRYLELLLDGVRPPERPRAPLPVPALNRDQIDTAMTNLQRHSPASRQETDVRGQPH
jgi:AcrR family transcriptional regulator